MRSPVPDYPSEISVRCEHCSAPFFVNDLSSEVRGHVCGDCAEFFDRVRPEGVPMEPKKLESFMSAINGSRLFIHDEHLGIAASWNGRDEIKLFDCEGKCYDSYFAEARTAAQAEDLIRKHFADVKGEVG